MIPRVAATPCPVSFQLHPKTCSKSPPFVDLKKKTWLAHGHWPKPRSALLTPKKTGIYISVFIKSAISDLDPKRHIYIGIYICHICIICISFNDLPAWAGSWIPCTFFWVGSHAFASTWKNYQSINLPFTKIHPPGPEVCRSLPRSEYEVLMSPWFNSIWGWLVVSIPLKNASQLGWWHSQYMEK